MSRLTDSELEQISDLLASGSVGNARKIGRLLSREPMERAREGRDHLPMAISRLLRRAIPDS